MANSSFDYFRKHSKVAIVALGVLCIMAFVVADPLLQYLADRQNAGARSDQGKVAVEWKGGELTEGDLSSLVYKRNILAGFLQAIEQEGYYEALAAGVPSTVTPRVQPLRLPTQYEQGVEQDVLQTQVFAQAAREAGMVISDETILDYLMALGRDKVSRGTMRDIIQSIQVGRSKATTEYIFELVREALLARAYFSSFVYSQATVMPQQRWEDWLKVYDRVVVETAALAVDDFVPRVEEPTDAELAKYFDEYKDVIPQPVIVDNRQLPSPTPGFRKPSKAKLQYVRAGYEEALEIAKEQVTAEEIATYYEENKAFFVKSDAEIMPELEGIEVVEDQEAESPGASGSNDANNEANDDASDGASEAPDAGDAPDDSEGSPATDEGDPDAGETEAGETPEAPPAAEQSGAAGSPNPFRLALFQATAADGEAPSETDGAAVDAPASEVDAPSEGPADTAEIDPLDEFLQGGDDEPMDDEAGDDEAAQDASGASPDGATVVEYQALEEVEDEIRDMLAQTKADESLQQKMNDLLGVLKNDYNVYFTKKLDAEAAKAQPPEPPAALLEWRKLAADNGLEFGETPLLSFFEMEKMEDPRLMYYFQQTDQQVPLAVQVFRRDGLELYEPDLSYDTDRNFYLVMKTEEVSESEPTLDEVRDEVVQAWKKEKAAQLALDEAKRLATQATESGRSLEDQFGSDDNLTIQESDMFAWLEPFVASTSGMYSLRLDTPGAIEGVGPEFMKTVFGLGPNEAGAALDHGHDNAYVIKIAQREKSQAELREQFLREWRNYPGFADQQRDHSMELIRAVFTQLIGGEQPDWKRAPDVSPMEREASEGA